MIVSSRLLVERQGLEVVLLTTSLCPLDRHWRRGWGQLPRQFASESPTLLLWSSLDIDRLFDFLVFCNTVTLMAQEKHSSIPVLRIILFYFPNDNLHRSSHEGPRGKLDMKRG
jgi:hypothetical protein